MKKQHLFYEITSKFDVSFLYNKCALIMFGFFLDPMTAKEKFTRFLDPENDKMT